MSTSLIEEAEAILNTNRKTVRIVTPKNEHVYVENGLVEFKGYGIVARVRTLGWYNNKYVDEYIGGSRYDPAHNLITIYSESGARIAYLRVSPKDEKKFVEELNQILQQVDQNAPCDI